MASIFPGYKYDIFISYRQKDNKYDGWVTKFVADLRKELEATFKEDISVYFDESPHDGLLEIHDVNKSLEGKLKCLIFIPIISQTYCDPRCFAWQNEFCAFNKLAGADQFGRDIKLSGGNVSSRILPVKINDLDAEDKSLLETELGGVLRSIEFIYKEPGVNRPLTPDDDEKKNLNSTKYRNQINKVANAIKEIIAAMKAGSSEYNVEKGLLSSSKTESLEEVSTKAQGSGILSSQTLKNRLIILLLTVLICATGVFAIVKITERGKRIRELSNSEKTIAVLPFRNLSNDSTQLPFCDGFVEEVRNNLQKVNNFTIRPITSSNPYRDTRKSAIIIGNELKVSYIVGGSVQREGDNLKIWVHLTDSKADKQIWSNEFTRDNKQIFSLQSEIATSIATELKEVLTPEEIKKIDKKPTENIEAYNYYILGNFYFTKSFIDQDLKAAANFYEKAIEIDPQFELAYAKLAICYLSQYWYYFDRSEEVLPKSKNAIDKAFELEPDLPEAHIALGYYYYWGFLMYPQALEQIEMVLKDQPANSEARFLSANIYRRTGNWEKSIQYFEKAMELDPRSFRTAFNTATALDLVREYSKAETYYRMAITLQPELAFPYTWFSSLYIKWDGDTKKAKEVLKNAAGIIRSFDSDSLIVEAEVNIDIYDSRYEEALNWLSRYESDFFQTQYYFRPKYFYYANIYRLKKETELEHAYWDSTRIFLEKKIIDLPEDPRLYSSLAIAYAGLGLADKAIYTGKKAVELLPVSKDAWKGVCSIEDLAYTYIIVGKYPEALEQIKYLLSIPGKLSVKMLELDPRWTPLKNLPEFKKILKEYSGN